MKNTFTELIEHLEDVITDSNKLISSAKYEDLSDMGDPSIQKVLTRQRAVIERICDKDSPYFKEMKSILTVNEYMGKKVVKILGILDALKSDFEKGYLTTFRELVHSEIFVDYLEMAKYLLDENYKDPAAVIIGSSLEVHILQLCRKFNIDIVRSTKKGLVRIKTDQLNADLTRISVYSKLDQKNVTAWLDLRNNAAHGNYSEYNNEQVVNMLAGVREFTTRNPA